MKFGKGYWKTFALGIEREWVITNGAGAYCGSSIIGANTRKHHGLLIASLKAPIERYLILSKIDECIKINNNTYSFATNQKAGGCNDEGQLYLQRFIYEEVPTFIYQAEECFVKKTIAFEFEKNTVSIGYDIINGSKDTIFTIKPLFSYRSHHDRSERAEIKYDMCIDGRTLHLTPKQNKNLDIKFYVSDGDYAERIQYDDRYAIDLEYQTEINTGMSCIDNQFTPYDINITLKPFEKKRVSVICSIEQNFEKDAFVTINKFINRIKSLKEQSGYKDELVNQLVQAADQFIVKRESTGYKTILAGYPWFSDWGRDTMIALQGLTLVTKRFNDAKGILRTFAKYINNGLVPNMFPDEGLEPLYNTVDASMWYFYSVYKYLEYTNDYDFIKEEIYPKLEEIINAYKNGTDFSIYMEDDGLIHAGGGFDQVTWMDVRVGEWVVTPRHGKPVEINALWYNALKVMEMLSSRFNKDNKEYSELAEKVKLSFREKFWNNEKKCLYDVIDNDIKDDKVRPNQIWAVSLPFTMLPIEQEKEIVNTVISELYSSYGLRSLSPNDAEYKGVYKGKLHDRDAAYHQGTVWAFPLGGLITAYVKVNNHSQESKEYARMLLEPIEDHLRDGCVGSIAEIFDGNEPHISRGCYAQAWSVGEILRAYVEDILN